MSPVGSTWKVSSASFGVEVILLHQSDFQLHVPEQEQTKYFALNWILRQGFNGKQGVEKEISLILSTPRNILRCPSHLYGNKLLITNFKCNRPFDPSSSGMHACVCPELYLLPSNYNLIPRILYLYNFHFMSAWNSVGRDNWCWRWRWWCRGDCQIPTFQATARRLVT